MSAEPAPTTRERLLELAAEVFAEEGYAAVSVRDLARRSSLTTGAIYAHFLNKAELLVEAIDARVATDVDTSRDRSDLTFLDYLTDLNRRYPERSDLRALLLEGATAARNDAAVRERLTAEQGQRLESWVAEYEAGKGRGELDPDLDMRAVVLMLWSIELGLGVVEALGLDAPDPDAWAELTRRLVRAIEAP
ncbi:MAG TPA: helix-turn-helix domain-containing protein [Acidimicrobiales bacterium]|nr:helix-turn-helix domain-containing protein [Acidimicrobiales bacterium]